MFKNYWTPYIFFYHVMFSSGSITQLVIAVTSVHTGFASQLPLKCLPSLSMSQQSSSEQAAHCGASVSVVVSNCSLVVA